MAVPGLTEGEIKDAPKVTLGGVVYSIPPLALKQNRVVVSGLETLLPVMARVEAMAKAAKAAIDAGQEPPAGWLTNFPLDEEQFGILMKVVHAALTRARPDLGFEEFENSPIGTDELLMALPVCIKQSFAFARKAKEEGKPQAPVGEAQAPAEAQSNGIALSSDSAAPSDGSGTTSKAA